MLNSFLKCGVAEEEREIGPCRRRCEVCLWLEGSGAGPAERPAGALCCSGSPAAWPAALPARRRAVDPKHPQCSPHHIARGGEKQKPFWGRKRTKDVDVLMLAGMEKKNPNIFGGIERIYLYQKSCEKMVSVKMAFG